MTTARKTTAPRKAPARRTPARPAGAPVPQDYQEPKTAAQREGEGVETETIEYNGFKAEIPIDPDNWPTLARQAFSTNRHIDAIEILLGPVQWVKFNQKFPLAWQFNEFAELIGEMLGFGNSGN